MQKDITSLQLRLVAAAQLGQMTETRQNQILKIREIDWSYLCLQQFDEFLKFSKQSTGNGNDVNQLTLAWKKLVISSRQVNLFLAGFSFLEALWAATPPVATLVVNLCSLWMSSEAFTGDRWRLPRLPTLYVEIDFSQTFQASPKFKDISKCTNI